MGLSIEMMKAGQRVLEGGGEISLYRVLSCRSYFLQLVTVKFPVIYPIHTALQVKLALTKLGYRMEPSNWLMPHSQCKLNQLKLNQVSEYGILIGQSNKASHLIG